MPDPRSTPARAALLTLLTLTAVVVPTAPASAYEQQITDQAQAIAEELANSETRTLAVVDFTDLQGNVTELGRFLAEELSVALTGLGNPGEGIEVVDRIHLKALLREHQLSLSGLLDPETAREVGQIAGVGALVTGTVTPLGDSVRLAVKVLHTESARIVTSTTANVPKTRAIEELLGREIVSGVTGQAQTASSNNQRSEQRRKEAGFLFKLRRCTLSGETLTCSLTVTNEQDDCQLTVYSSISRIVDEQGEQYSGEQLQFAGHSSSGGIREVLVREIPTSIQLTFLGVAPTTSTLPLLEVQAVAGSECSGGYSRFTAQFRDIRIQRE